MIFNRFAKEPRRCVVAAVEEARALGHDSVGDEDLLLGMMRADEGLAFRTLASLGVSLEAARTASEEMASEALFSIGISLEDVRREAGDAFNMRLPDDRRIPFSPRAKKALEQALEEALGLGDNRIGTEHVLLGLVRNEGGTSVRLLGRLGVSPEALEDRLYELRDRTAD